MGKGRSGRPHDSARSSSARAPPRRAVVPMAIALTAAFGAILGLVAVLSHERPEAPAPVASAGSVRPAPPADPAERALAGGVTFGAGSAPFP